MRKLIKAWLATDFLFMVAIIVIFNYPCVAEL